MSTTLTTTIEISAPPEVVRAKFLDFTSMSTYSPNGYINSITPIAPATSLRLEPGERIQVEMKGATFKPTIVNNSPSEFSWIGSLPYIFTGTHRFTFHASKTTPDGTTFTQSESFTGLLSFLMGTSFLANKSGTREGTRRGWERFDEDLKRVVENEGAR